MAHFRIKAPGDWHIPGWLFYGISIVFIGLALMGWQTHSRKNMEQNKLLTWQNEAQGRYFKAKNNQKSIKYTVSPNGSLSNQGLALIQTGNKVLTLGTTFQSQSQYNNNVKQIRHYVWATNMFAKNAFFGQRDNYFSWVQSVKSQTQEVDTYQLDTNHYLAIVRYVTYVSPSALNYINQLHNTYRAFVFTGAQNKILQMSELDGFYSPSGYQSNS